MRTSHFKHRISHIIKTFLLQPKIEARKPQGGKNWQIIEYMK